MHILIDFLTQEYPNMIEKLMILPVNYNSIDFG